VLAGLILPQLDRQAPRSLPVANACAALTELYHYSQPQTVYEACLDPREPLRDPGRPFQTCVLVPERRGEAAGAVGQAAGFLLQELLTPPGRLADEARDRTGAAVRTFGSYRLSWPRRRPPERPPPRFRPRRGAPLQ